MALTPQQQATPASNPNPFDALSGASAAPNVPSTPPDVPATPPAIGATPANGSVPAPAPPQKPNVLRRVGQKVDAGINAFGNAANPQYEANPAGVIAQVPTRSLFKNILSAAVASLAGIGAGAEGYARATTDKDGRPIPTSKAGAFGIGLNAGIENQMNRTAAARQEAADDFERQQKALVQKAQIAHANISTMKAYFDLKNQGIAEDTTRNKAIGNAFEDAGYQTQVVDTNDLQAQRAKDPHFLTNNLVLPLGWTPVNAPDGTPLFNTDGSPRESHQVLVINIGNGVDSATGRVFLPPAVVAEIQDHGERAGIQGAKSITDDTEVSAGQFADILTTLKKYSSNVAKGWQWAAQNPDKALALSKDGKPVFLNPVSGEPRPWDGPVPAAMQAKIDAANALAKQRNSVAAKNDALAKNGGKAPAKPRASDPYTAARRFIGDTISQAKTNSKSLDLTARSAAQQQLADAQIAQSVVDLFASKKYGGDQEKQFIASSKSLTQSQKTLIKNALGLE